MLIETIMYFALGFLAAGLLALMIMPAVWRRGRTADTYADRGSHADYHGRVPGRQGSVAGRIRPVDAPSRTQCRSLEIQAGRAGGRHLPPQVGTEPGQGRTRTRKLTIIGELEDRESELRTPRARTGKARRRPGPAPEDARPRLRQYLRPARIRPHLRSDPDQHAGHRPALCRPDGGTRTRRLFRGTGPPPVSRGWKAPKTDSSAAAQAVAELRDALSRKDDETDSSHLALSEAEARIASAENRLNALLHETEQTLETEEDRHAQLLAEKTLPGGGDRPVA